MKKIGLVLLCCFSIFKSQGQITFEREDSVDGLALSCLNSTRILQTPDHGYLSTGKICSGLVTLLYWEKIDSTGHYLWSYYSGYNVGDVKTYTTSLTSDGGLILCGGAEYQGGFFPIIIIKTHSDGTVQWSKIIHGVYDLYGYSIRQTKDGGYIIAGTIMDILIWNGIILKLDSVGNILWSKNYSLGSQFTSIVFNDVVETTDSGFVVVGKINSTSLTDEMFFMRTDSNGDTLWTKQYNSSIMPMEAMSIAMTLDSCFAISGRDNSTNFGSVLLKITYSGDTLWKKEFGYGDSILINNVQQVNDSGLILSANGMIIKTNSSGDILWSRGQISNCNYVIPTSDNGFAIAGGPSFCTIKTDSVGNTVCTANPTLVTTSRKGMNEVYNPIYISTDTLPNQFTGFGSPPYVEERMLCNSLQSDNLHFERNKIEIFPNPSSQVIKIISDEELSSFEIYNALGVMAKNSTLKNKSEMEIDISDLFPTIYIIKLYSKEGTSTLKFMKSN